MADRIYRLSRGAGAPPLRTHSATAARAVVGPAVRPQVGTTVRHGLCIYFLLVIFEGVFRKWVAPEWNQYIYVAKDAVLAILCLRVLLSLGRIPSPDWLCRKPVGQLFAVFAIYGIVEGFNVALPNTMLGLWGIRTYVLPMSLAYLVPLGFPNPRITERYFRYYLLLGIPIAILCMAQYRLPAGHLLNKYANVELGENIATVMDVVRVSGPFSYISGLGAYLAFEAAGLLGVLFAARWKIGRHQWLWLALILTIGVIPMTGSRAIALYFVLYVLVIVAMSPLLKLRGGPPSRLFLVGICVASLCIGLFGEAFDRLAERARTSRDTHERIYNLVLKPVDFLDDAGLFGFGAAATHQAAPVLVPGGDSYYWLTTRAFEDEPGRVMLELGGIGFALYMALKIGVCTAVYRYIRRYGHAVPLAIPIACLLISASSMITGMVFNSVGASFYWGMFGLFLAQANATRVLAMQS